MRNDLSAVRRVATLFCCLAASVAAQDALSVREESAGRRALVAESAQDLGATRAVVRRTDAAVSDARTIRVENSRTVLAVWRETDASGARDWTSASQDGGVTWFEARPADFELRLQYATFDPLVSVPAVPADLAAPPTSRRWIVQYAAPGLPAMRGALAARGAANLFHLPHHADVVDADPAAVEALRALPFVRWVGPFHPAYRLFPEDRAALAAGALPEGAAWNVVVPRPHDLAAKERVVAALAPFGAAPLFPVVRESRLLTLTMPVAAVRAALRLDDVAWIDRWSPPQDDMDLARQATGAVYLAGLSPTAYQGEGVRGQVMDGGTRTTHVDFGGLIWLGTPASGNHGTSTYGIVFGKGVGNPQGLGMLPNAQGIAGNYNDPLMSSNRYAYTQQLLLPGYEASFQSNSWGSSLTTAYTSISQTMDDIVFDLDFLICQSQSNNGDQLSRPQAWAKNVVSVGGVRHFGTLSRADDSWTGGASIGPAADGRLKPDVSNYYDATFTTNGTNDTAYTTSFGGTSGATPITAGCVGLLHQMWDAGLFGPTKLGATPFARKPAAATTKALLVNTAQQYAFAGTGADLSRYKQGWGTGDVAAAHDLAVAGKIFVVDETQVLAPLATASYATTVASGEPEFQATLVYRDPAGTTSATLHRINNLDLRVTAPNGTVYWGNVGLDAGNASVAGGGPNGVDNVENVIVPSPAAGVWTVEVIAAEINQDGFAATAATDAVFALVVGGATGPAPAAGGAGQANAAAAWFDVNGGVDALGRPAWFGLSGPFAATAVPGGSLTFSYGGAANRPVVLMTGPLNPGNVVFPTVGSLDLGLGGLANLGDIAFLMDGVSGTTFFDLFANTGPTGARALAFTVPALPSGPLGAFQAVVIDPLGIPYLTAAFSVAVP
jgi:serine protease AprX